MPSHLKVSLFEDDIISMHGFELKLNDFLTNTSFHEISREILSQKPLFRCDSSSLHLLLSVSGSVSDS